METLNGSAVLEIMVMVLEVTGFSPVIQVALEVRVQVILSPFKGDQVKVELFVP